LAWITLLFLSADGAPAAPFGTGPGAWPLEGALYEVSLEYFTNHSLNELTENIPRLKKLGVSVIYLTPIFKCVGAAQYLIVDYFAINPRYGTEADLKKLVAVAHQNKIKLLLDLVTSLTYEGTNIMNQHPEWILMGRDGQRQRYYPMPIFGWALDCTNPEVISFFTKVARYYLEHFGVDGWRVDSPTDNYDSEKVSGDHTRLKLLRAVRTAAVETNKNTIFIGEVSGPTVLFGKPGSSREPLFDEMLEANYDYEYCGFLGGNAKSGYSYVLFDGPPSAGRLAPTPLNAVAHNQLSSADFVESVQRRRILFDRLRANFVENHDTERVSKAFPNQHKALFVLIATMPGIPVVHAGQEIGSMVHPDAGGSTTVVVDWSKGDPKLESFYARVLKIRANHSALLRGDIRNIWKSGDQTIAFLRSIRSSQVVVALNFASRPADSVIRLPIVDLGLQPDRSYQVHDELTGEKLFRSGKQLENMDLHLEPYGQRILAISATR
jgi:cyclomaltodextrinase / maltogenic alpha-amylase / neopullulanase